MKKIIKISVIVFGVCFFGGKADAQLASDQPAMTPVQVEQLRKVPAAKPAVTVQTASSSPATAGAVAGAKAATVVIPSQGGVTTATEHAVDELKTAPVPAKTEEKEKKKNR